MQARFAQQPEQVSNEWLGISLQDPAVLAIYEKFATFDAADAECFLPGDKDMILGVIETGIGSLDEFNKLVQKTFARQTAPRTNSRASSMDTHSSSAYDHERMTPHSSNPESIQVAIRATELSVVSPVRNPGQAPISQCLSQSVKWYRDRTSS